MKTTTMKTSKKALCIIAITAATLTAAPIATFAEEITTETTIASEESTVTTVSEITTTAVTETAAAVTENNETAAVSETAATENEEAATVNEEQATVENEEVTATEENEAAVEATDEQIAAVAAAVPEEVVTTAQASAIRLNGLTITDSNWAQAVSYVTNTVTGETVTVNMSCTDGSTLEGTLDSSTSIDTQNCQMETWIISANGEIQIIASTMTATDSTVITFTASSNVAI